MDFLFGLDNLRRYRCCIDLTRNCLRLEGSNGPEEVPFLSEHELEGVDSNFNNPTDENSKPSGDTTATSSSSVPGGGSSSSATNNNTTATSSSSSTMMDVETTSSSNSNSGNTVAVPPSDRTEKIEQLMGLGFPRADAEMALNQADGDVNLAATFLFAQQG